MTRRPPRSTLFPYTTLSDLMSGFAEVQRQFITNGEFTAGLATQYPPGLLTGDDTHLHLATGYPPGRRFKSGEVIRLSRSEEHTSELQSQFHLVCRLLLEKKK